MNSSKARTRQNFEFDFEQFVTHPRGAWYWTFTFADLVAEKDEAVRRFKPFSDLVRRRGGKLLVVWELQKRGAWHVHCLVDLFLDVNWLRPWMEARGWGRQMFVKRLPQVSRYHMASGEVLDEAWKLTGLKRYLCKYLTKSLAVQSRFTGRAYCPSRGAKKSTCRRTTLPEHGNPSAYLYAHGRQLFYELHKELPRFRDMGQVIRLGAEATDWKSIDPWWDG